MVSPSIGVNQPRRIFQIKLPQGLLEETCWISPWCKEMEICKFNQFGFCKFGGKCFNKHENEICRNRNECTDSNCNKRHPRKCRYFLQSGYCKFKDTCAYSHMVDKNSKVEELEKENAELKEEVDKLKRIYSKVEDLEKEKAELKKEVDKLKRIMFMMNKKIKEFESVAEVKSNESKETNDVNEKNKKENSEENEEQELKCDKCEYRTKRKIALKKHMNTKHKNTDKSKEEKRKENETVNSDKDVNEKNCSKCENCEKCDYLKNSDKCGKCDTIFEAAIDEYVVKGKQSALHSKLHTT